jgi:ribosomal protein L40E
MEIVVILAIVIAAVAAVMLPLVKRSAGERLDRPPETPPDDASLEAEIAAYRTALRAGTLCRRCGAANPEASRYCAECGRRLEREVA